MQLHRRRGTGSRYHPVVGTTVVTATAVSDNDARFPDRMTGSTLVPNYRVRYLKYYRVWCLHRVLYRSVIHRLKRKGFFFYYSKRWTALGTGPERAAPERRPLKSGDGSVVGGAARWDEVEGSPGVVNRRRGSWRSANFGCAPATCVYNIDLSIFLIPHAALAFRTRIVASYRVTITRFPSKTKHRWKLWMGLRGLSRLSSS